MPKQPERAVIATTTLSMDNPQGKRRASCSSVGQGGGIDLPGAGLGGSPTNQRRGSVGPQQGDKFWRSKSFEKSNDALTALYGQQHAQMAYATYAVENEVAADGAPSAPPSPAESEVEEQDDAKSVSVVGDSMVSDFLEQEEEPGAGVCAPELPSNPSMPRAGAASSSAAAPSAATTTTNSTQPARRRASCSSVGMGGGIDLPGTKQEQHRKSSPGNMQPSAGGDGTSEKFWRSKSFEKSNDALTALYGEQHAQMAYATYAVENDLPLAGDEEEVANAKEEEAKEIARRLDSIMPTGATSTAAAAPRSERIRPTRTIAPAASPVPAITKTSTESPSMYASAMEHKIMQSAIRGDADLLKLSLGHASSRLDSALLWATFAGQLEAVQMLVHQGGDVNARDASGRTPAHWAALMGHVHVLQWLIGQGADVLALTTADGSSSSSSSGLTPLELAVWKGRYEIAEWLCEGESGPVAEPELHETMMRLLHTKPHLPRAVASGRAEVAAWLLERGVTVDGVDEHAKTALWHAAEGRDATLAGWLISKGAMPARLPMSALTELLCAAANVGDTALVRMALAAGGPASVAGRCQSTAAEWAVIGGHAECVALLAASRADVVSALGCLPARDVPPSWPSIHHIIRHASLPPETALCDPDLVERIHSCDSKGRTPLHHAAYTDAYGWAQALLLEGVDITQADCDGWMAIHEACAQGSSSVVELLVSSGGSGTGRASLITATLLHEDRCGRLPIELLPNESREAILPILLKAGSPNPSGRLFTVHMPRVIYFILLTIIIAPLVPLIHLSAFLRATDPSDILALLTPLPSSSSSITTTLSRLLDGAALISLVCIALLLAACLALASRPEAAYLIVGAHLFASLELIRLLLRKGSGSSSSVHPTFGYNKMQAAEAEAAAAAVAVAVEEKLEHEAAAREALTFTYTEDGMFSYVPSSSGCPRFFTDGIRRMIRLMILLYNFFTTSMIEVLVLLLTGCQLLALLALLQPTTLLNALLPFAPPRELTRKLLLNTLLLDDCAPSLTNFTPRYSSILIYGILTTLFALSIHATVFHAHALPTLRKSLPNAAVTWRLTEPIVRIITQISLSLLLLPSIILPVRSLGSSSISAEGVPINSGYYNSLCGGVSPPSPSLRLSLTMLATTFAIVSAAAYPTLATPGNTSASKRSTVLPDPTIHILNRGVLVLSALITLLGLTNPSTASGWACLGLAVIQGGVSLSALSQLPPGRDRPAPLTLAYAGVFGASAWCAALLGLTDLLSLTSTPSTSLLLGWAVLLCLLFLSSRSTRAATAKAFEHPYLRPLLWCLPCLGGGGVSAEDEGKVPLLPVNASPSSSSSMVPTVPLPQPPSRLTSSDVLHRVVKRMGNVHGSSGHFPPGGGANQVGLEEIGRSHEAFQLASEQSAPPKAEREAMWQEDEALLSSRGLAAHGLAHALAATTPNKRAPEKYTPRSMEEMPAVAAAKAAVAKSPRQSPGVTPRHVSPTNNANGNTAVEVPAEAAVVKERWEKRSMSFDRTNRRASAGQVVLRSEALGISEAETAAQTRSTSFPPSASPAAAAQKKPPQKKAALALAAPAATEKKQPRRILSFGRRGTKK